MKFKVDENLPSECAALLRDGGHSADTVADEGLVGADDSVLAGRARIEERVLMTLDLDFANVQAYPPAEHSGIIVLRLKRQDKRTVLVLMSRIISALTQRIPFGELWIVEPDRIRFRGR